VLLVEDEERLANTVREGLRDDGFAVDAFDLAADDYLTKPVSLMARAARLRALVRRGAPERPVVLAAGDLTLDPARRLVMRAGRSVCSRRASSRSCIS
jgi:DNA-binding response OmpR family regulator